MERIIGLDLGTTSLGIAISDTLGLAAHGLENFRFEKGNYKKAKQRVKELIEQYNVKTICLGLPLHMSGAISERAESSMRFKDELMNENPDISVILIDERMSTIIASNRLKEANLSAKKRKEVIDKMSAVVILDSYLERIK